MGLFSTLGTIVGGVAGTFLGNPMLGAQLGGTLGGVGDKAVESKKAEERAKEERLRQELQMRQQAAGGFAQSTTPFALGSTSQDSSNGLWETALQGTENMANQVFGEISQKQNKNSQQTSQNTQNQQTQQTTQQQTSNQNASLYNNIGQYLFPTRTPQPTNQFDIYSEILKGIKGG